MDIDTDMKTCTATKNMDTDMDMEMETDTDWDMNTHRDTDTDIFERIFFVRIPYRTATVGLTGHILDKNPFAQKIFFDIGLICRISDVADITIDVHVHPPTVSAVKIETSEQKFLTTIFFWKKKEFIHHISVQTSS
jgi:hypothetical protein